MQLQEAELEIMFAKAEDITEADVYIVKIQVSEHGRPDCVQAKEAEAQNLLNFET